MYSNVSCKTSGMAVITLVWATIYAGWLRGSPGMTVILHTDITYYSYVVNVIVMRQNLVLFHGIVYMRANMQASGLFCQ